MENYWVFPDYGKVKANKSRSDFLRVNFSVQLFSGITNNPRYLNAFFLKQFVVLEFTARGLPEKPIHAA